MGEKIMTLIKWDDKPSIFKDINEWFNIITDDFYNDQTNINNSWNPNFEIIKQKDNYIIIAELAGLSKKDITIELVENILKISGERKFNDTKNINENIYSQINYGSFEKSFKLNKNVNKTKINANMDDGILQIT